MFFPFFLFCFYLGSVPLFSEDIPSPIPKDKVGLPLPYHSPVSGTFAEIRNHNLHLGSDFKSYGLNGHSILATFDGYVDEIFYSKVGYGLSLNIYNPNYRVKSKYAHLHSFAGKLPDLENLRKALLFMGEKEGFKIKLPTGMFSAKKGDPIGKTGESGSGISHLHLEFHSEKFRINPLSFPAYQKGDVTPPTILSFLIEGDQIAKPILLNAKEIQKGKYKLYDTDDRLVESLSLSGNLKLRIGGYDIIRSRNKNNVYGMDLSIDGKEIFSRKFDFLSASGEIEKHQFYDVNRSSLSPPVYFYHLYDQKKMPAPEAYSIQLSSYKPGSKLEIEAALFDAAGNRSVLSFSILHEINGAPKPSLSQITQKKFLSKDKVLSFDISSVQTSGSGTVEIEEYENLDQIPFKIPKDLILRSKIYRITTNHLSWKGEASGEFLPTQGSSSKDALFFWDESIKNFSYFKQKRKASGFQFQLAKLGYIMVLEDKSPPYVLPMTSLARHIELPEIREQCFEDRFYVLGDSGTGFKTNVELLLDGQAYPYEYDPDRTAIRVSLPKSLYKERPYLLLEVRAFDYAGNVSLPFIDVIATKGWKLDTQTSCPLIE